VLGAGTGNDVVAALANGATHVDAVEIDPVIAEFGKKAHPARPYQDSRVNLVIDDGRAFMSRAKDRYDLIVFALPDSVVKVSSMSQLRLENYLLTEQAVQKAYSLLTDSGDIVFYNYYRQFWLLGKMRAMILNATGKPPRFLNEPVSGGVFAILKVGKPLDSVGSDRSGLSAVDAPTDSWPFPYLEKRGIPSVYLKGMIGMGVFVALLMLVVSRPIGRKKVTPGSSRSRPIWPSFSWAWPFYCWKRKA